MTTTQDRPSKDRHEERPTLAADAQRAQTVRSYAEAFALGRYTLPELLAAVYNDAREAGRAEGIMQAKVGPSIPGAIVVPDHFAHDGRPLVLVDFADPFAAGVENEALDRFVIQTSRPVSENEIDHLWHLMAYTYRATVRGRSVGRPERIAPDMFQVPVDLSASPRTSVHDAVWEFVTDYADVVVTGSPIRHTNRGGPGTAGTRAVDAFHDPDVMVRILVPRFVGYVTDETPAATPAAQTSPDPVEA
jgi:hypothetical protein